jgi:hypothetical protein
MKPTQSAASKTASKNASGAYCGGGGVESYAFWLSFASNIPLLLLKNRFVQRNMNAGFFASANAEIVESCRNARYDNNQIKRYCEVK